jgi:NAD+ diphosphatase
MTYIPDEPSTRVAFTGSLLERKSEKRTDDAIDLARADASTRWFVHLGGKIALQGDGDTAPRALFEAEELTAFEPDFSEAVLLGFDDGRAVCAVPGGLDPEALTAPFSASDLRPLFAQGLLPRGQLSMLAQAASLHSWHTTHKYCGRCGARNVMKSGGVKRICDGCGAEHFPRTDPVVIMLTVHGGRCLLARGAHFPEGMVSCLAGFMEPGESIEEAVRRETLEEAGLQTGKVTYHASQPWPFQHSLMIGCFAEALDDRLTLDASELEAGGWHSRGDVRLMLEGKHPAGLRLPPDGAIANLLIRDWVHS